MWKDLSIQQKSEVMKMAVSQGLTDLNEIKKMYDASIPNIEASSVNNTYSSVPYNPSPKDVRYDDGGQLNRTIRKLTPNGFYEEDVDNTEYGPYELDEVTVSPSRNDKSTMLRMQSYFPDKKVRTALSNVAGINSLSGGRDRFGNPVGYLPPNDFLNRLMHTMDEAGKPSVFSNNIYSSLISLLPDMKQPDGRMRAHTFPNSKLLFLDSKNVGEGLDDIDQILYDDLVAEIAHKWMQANGYPSGNHISSADWEYDDPRMTEYRTHSIIEPHLDDYIKGNWENLNYLQSKNSLRTDYRIMSGSPMPLSPGEKLKYQGLLQEDEISRREQNLLKAHPFAYGGPLGNIYKGTGNKSQKLNIWTSGAWTADDLASELLRLGVRARVTSKGRSAKQQARFNTPANRSWHVKNKAIDVVPTTNWDDLKADLLKPEVRSLFNSAGIGVLDERPASVQRKTGATGAHFHIGPDRSARAGYATWTNSKMPNGPQINVESPVFHTAANDLQWQPTIVASSRQEDIAPLLVQNNKPLIVEPLENTSSTPKDFSAIWDQIFPKVENTQEEFNPLLDPSTQFTALQSRPRYQMKPTPIINMPISNGDNDYMLFKPLAKGGNLFDDGSYLRNYQWRIMPETDAVHNDYYTGLPVQAGDKVWTDEQGNIVTTNNNPSAAADYAVQYGNPTFELDMPEITIEGLGNGKSRGHLTGESFEDRYARLLAAPIAKNADVDDVFKEQNQQLVDFEIEKERQHRANEEFNRQVDNLFGANWLRPSQWVGAFNPGGVDDGVSFGERLLLGTNNYGLWNTNSEFLREHPYLAEGANILFDLAAPQAILNGIPEMYNAARYNPYTLSRAMNSTLKGAEIPREVLVPKSRFKLGDLELNDPNLMYHYDYGDYFGGYGRRGPYVEDGLLYPGETTVEGQKNYSWWNKGQPFSRFSKNGSSFGYSRMTTTHKDNPNLINVRSQDYPIGQWNGKNGFVRTSEYVSSKPVDVGHSTYIFDPEYGFRRTDTPYNFSTEVGTLDDLYARAVFYGDKETAQQLRNLHFSDASGINSPVPWFHGSTERNLTSFNPYAESGTFEGSGNTTFLALDRPIAAYYGREIPNKSSMRPFEQLIRKLDEGKVYSMYANVHNPKIVNYKGASFNGFGTKIHYIDPLTEEAVSIKPTTGQEYFPHNYYEGPTKLNEFTGEQGIPVTIGDTETVVAPQDLIYQKVFVNKSSAQAAEEAIREGYDAAILDNIVEGVVKNKDGTYLSTTDLAVGDPRLLKSSDAITYDDLGLPIPLRFRDNFFLNDFRYSTGGKLKSRKTKK